MQQRSSALNISGSETTAVPFKDFSDGRLRFTRRGAAGASICPNRHRLRQGILHYLMTVALLAACVVTDEVVGMQNLTPQQATFSRVWHRVFQGLNMVAPTSILLLALAAVLKHLQVCLAICGRQARFSEDSLSCLF